MTIPRLSPSVRSREFRQFSFVEIARIVDKWLFASDTTHRQLDRDILGIDPGYSQGFQSMGVLHFLGLTKEFHGIFESRDRSEVIQELKKSDQDFNQIINYLEHKKEDKDFIVAGQLIESGRSRDSYFDERYGKRLRELESTDGRSNNGHSRKEQPILKALLFKDASNMECSLCHKNLPTEIMVLAHIKPRSECSFSERTDLSVVMPVCKIGCDDLFEKGYLIVSD